ncbi:hypothetical protein DFH05DRAFT_1483555 [Lentinula detonsa]|uniref:Uncharacterized protein n=1 Tax=Lentinula detonsa TaxID=2804962 RepID=A0A9W8TZ89_9AGAR|nr:hypothetical protein DFH05DRAFT_1483555 [Lentinula detonsa]
MFRKFGIRLGDETGCHEVGFMVFSIYDSGEEFLSGLLVCVDVANWATTSEFVQHEFLKKACALSGLAPFLRFRKLYEFGQIKEHPTRTNERNEKRSGGRGSGQGLYFVHLFHYTTLSLFPFPFASRLALLSSCFRSALPCSRLLLNVENGKHTRLVQGLNCNVSRTMSNLETQNDLLLQVALSTKFTCTK